MITYYHHFRQTPAAHHRLALCQAEACQARGGRALTQQAQQSLDCALGQTRSDHQWQLEGVACLGLCASGPALELDGSLYAQVTPQRLAQLLAPIQGPADAHRTPLKEPS